ncbi:MAG: glycosyltransferase [Acidobacteriota bacterium]
MTQRPAVELSVVIPVTDSHDDLLEIHSLFDAECRRLGRSYEVIVVVHGEHAGLRDTMDELARRERVKTVWLAFTHDESAALNEGFRRARGQWIVTLPAYHSVHPSAMGRLIAAAEEGADCALAVRSRRRDPLFNRLQGRLYSALVSLVAGRRLRDISTAASAMRADVARHVVLYGDQYRYLPVLLVARGYRVVEVEVPQSEQERSLRIFSVGTYLNRMVDLLAIFFLVRFTKRPLRFFGVLGGALAGAGLLLCALLSWQRLVYDQALANRPALLLGVLLLVLGVQTGALGLLGELVVHLQAQHGLRPEAEEMDREALNEGSGPPASQGKVGSLR